MDQMLEETLIKYCKMFFMLQNQTNLHHDDISMLSTNQEKESYKNLSHEQLVLNTCTSLC